MAAAADSQAIVFTDVFAVTAVDKGALLLPALRELQRLS
jgi:hypothetical protein